MNQVLSRTLDATLAPPASHTTLNCEGQLRIAAATLAHTMSSEITATTVVGVLGMDDIAAFQALVARISDEFELDARVRIHVGSYSVRFTQRVAAGPSASSSLRAAHSGHPSPRTGGLIGRFLQSFTTRS